jgi:6-phosphogluconolactonase (cycloisomerase 2 family)
MLIKFAPKFWLKTSVYAFALVSGLLTTACGDGGGPKPPPAGAVHYAYVVNSPSSTTSSNTLAAYSVSSATGLFAYLGTIATGNTPVGAVVSPNGSYVYVVNYMDSTISQYAVNPANGVLTAGATVASASGTQNAAAIAITPSGKYAYVANFTANTIWQYSVSPTTGALSVTAGSTPVSTGTNSYPQGVTVSPDGTNLYVANYGATGATGTGSISRYSIDAVTGALTFFSKVTLGGGLTPSGIAISASGNYAYVIDYNQNSISQYAITSGVIATTPLLTVATGTNPNGLSIGRDGLYLYVANSRDGTVGQFAINSTTGALTLNAIMNTGTGSLPMGIAL